jgi:hypothetical protein
MINRYFPGKEYSENIFPIINKECSENNMLIFLEHSALQANFRFA